MARKSTDSEEVVIVTNEPPATTEDIQHASKRVNNEVAAADLRRKQLAREYSGETKVTVMIAPMYEMYFGKTMHVSVNGISISVPCDGKPYTIPETYAAVVQHRLRKVNEQHLRQARLANVQNNSETSPGALTLT